MEQQSQPARNEPGAFERISDRIEYGTGVLMDACGVVIFGSGAHDALANNPKGYAEMALGGLAVGIGEMHRQHVPEKLKVLLRERLNAWLDNSK